MTALELVGSIFGRPGSAPDLRPVTAAQLGYLRDLMERDPVRPRAIAPGELEWRPSGRWRYVLKEDPGGHHSLRRAGVHAPPPRLF